MKGSDPEAVTSIEYMDSQRSFKPSPSESLTLGLVPIAASSMFVSASLSGSPFGPLSGSGNVSFCSPPSAPGSGFSKSISVI